VRFAEKRGEGFSQQAGVREERLERMKKWKNECIPKKRLLFGKEGEDPTAWRKGIKGKIHFKAD